MSRKKFFSFCIIKPPAVERKQHMKILRDIISDFEIIHFFPFVFERRQAEDFYKNISDKPFFNDYMDSMVDELCYGMVLWSYDPNLVKNFREFMGATDPKKAADGTIRKKYGISIDDNVVHGSDSDESALREIELILPGLLENPLKKNK
jgi:nucleoside-diphosphate kinase